MTNPMTTLGPNARRVARDTLLVAPGYLVPGMATLIGVPILFRTLGAAQYGLWSLINAIASGVPPLTTSSVEALTLRFSHREHGRHRLAEWGFATAASALLGAILAGLFVPDAPVGTLLVTASLSAAVSVYLIWIASLQAQLRFGSSSAAASFRAVVGLALAIAGAVATGSAVFAALGLAAGFMIGIVASFVSGRPASAVTMTAQLDMPSVGRVSYGAASIIVAVGLFVLSFGDRFLLSALAGLADLGVYAAVYTIEDLVLRLTPAVLLVAVRPRVFRAWDSADSRRVTTGTAGITALILWLGVVGTSGIILVGDVFGSSSVALPLLGPIALGLSASVAATSVSFLYSASEQQWRLALHVAIAALLNVELNLVLIPSHGSVGAAYATAISFALLLALHLAGYWRELTRDRHFVWLGIAAMSTTIVVGLGSSLSGGLIWPALGFLVAAILAPLSRSSARTLLVGLESPAPSREPDQAGGSHGPVA